MEIINSLDQALELTKNKLQEMSNPPIFWAGHRTEDAWALNAVLPYPVDYSIGLDYGSSTEYLERFTKVISVEKNNLIRKEWNARIASEMFDEKSPSYSVDLKNIKDGFMFPFASIMHYETYCYNHNIKMMSPPSIMRSVENKSYLRSLSKNLKLKVPNHYISTLETTSYKEANSILHNDNGLYIIQTIEGAAGVGTIVVNSEQDYQSAVDKFGPKATVIISNYHPGPSSATTCFITPYDIHILQGYQQLMSNQETSKNSFCYSGNSFVTLAPKWEKFRESVLIFCKWLQRQGFYGIANFDGVEQNIVDVNPRCPGSIRVLTEIQLSLDQVPLVLLQFMHYLGIQFRLSGKLKDKYDEPLKGSMMILHSLETKESIVSNEVKPGVYKFVEKDKHQLRWVKDGWSWKDFNENQVLLTSGVVRKSTKVYPNAPLGRVWTKQEVNDLKSGRLNEFGRKLTKTVYNLFRLNS